MADRPLGAQISRMLEARGVRVIFGIPGVHNIELYRGLEETGIQHVLARHEQGAGFMADGYARATGRPGIAYVISGPGLTNIMTPVGQAWSDSVPVLVISSCLDETAWRRGQLHQMKDQAGAGACVADWSEVARDAQAAYGLIERAFAEFGAARPRPKHLSLPIALMSADAPAPPAPAARPGLALPDPAVLDRAARMLGAAERPLVLLGGGARGGAQAARALVDARKAASVCSYAGRGIVPDGAPLALGPALPHPGSVPLIASADLVVVVGSELAEVDLWRAELGHDAPMIRVDIDPEA
ncbi:MAG TPA: acetolactate synthase isozyme1 large subunit, partial [Aliiroseovarius sp.]|nr:acetolactate synthase isozyme1 large subunit [Aliiroseovarius sp.]